MTSKKRLRGRLCSGRNKLSNVRNFILLAVGRGRASTSSTEISELTFVVKKTTMKLSEVFIKREQARKLKIKCRARPRPGPPI